jgi:hypothetical protein
MSWLDFQGWILFDEMNVIPGRPLQLLNCSEQLLFDVHSDKTMFRNTVSMQQQDNQTCFMRYQSRELSCSDARFYIAGDVAKILNASEEAFIAINASVALACAPDASSHWADPEGILTLVCQLLSIICLAVTLGVYSAVPSLRSVPGQCVMNLCCAMMIAQIVLQFSSFATELRGLCVALAALDHWAMVGRIGHKSFFLLQKELPFA